MVGSLVSRLAVLLKAEYPLRVTFRIRARSVAAVISAALEATGFGCPIASRPVHSQSRPNER